MDEIRTELYLHAIFIVDAHKKLIVPKLQDKIYKLIEEAIERLNCSVLAIGGTENHVHLLFDLNPDISIEELLKTVKLSTQTEIRHSLNPSFFWEDGYYVYSIGSEDIEAEKHKIKQEAIKHINLTLAEELQKLRDELQMNETDDLTDINENNFN